VIRLCLVKDIKGQSNDLNLRDILPLYLFDDFVMWYELWFDYIAVESESILNPDSSIWKTVSTF
jgi:hypothetical protein